MKPVVDVIIPVYRGEQETRRCLDSVLHWPQRTPHRVIVIDDASPEASLSAYLDRLAVESRIELIRHARNQGFVRSANAGIGRHPDRDCVLLNSDTEVANDWLDRLRACALANDRVATVTPFSNNATILSYPCPSEPNPLPPGFDTAALDELFRACNPGATAELPTGVGCCLYITRDSLAALGDLDAEAFGLGYGEEVDFCQRASQAGWRNLLCAEVFVYHRGEVSFRENGAARRAAAQDIIAERYPDYAGQVAAFVQRDPPRPYRRAVDLARLCASPLPRLLFVSHAWGGGVARHVEDLAAALAGRAEVLLLQPQGSGQGVLRWQRSGEALAIYRSWASGPQSWLELLGQLGLSRVHYHHWQGLPPWILDLAAGLGLPYDVTLHDYQVVCPQLHFVDATGSYCGEPANPAICDGCLAIKPAQWGLAIRTWRRRHLDWLAAAARVIAPSHDVAERLHRYRSDLPLQIWPHPEPPPVSNGAVTEGLATLAVRRRKVAVLGSLSDAKGLKLVAACAEQAAQHDLALDLVVIGSVQRPVLAWPVTNLTILGEYSEAQLGTILLRERPDAVLFASIIPETYSYTLSVAMRTGLPILALAIGAFPERLRDYPAAQLLPPGIDAPGLAARLLALPPAYASAATPARAPATAFGLVPADYTDRYLAPIQAVGAVAPVAVEARHYYPARAGEAAPPIRVLYEQGIQCGKAEPRAQLERELRDVDTRLHSLAERASEATRQRDRLHDEVAGLKQTLARFERAHRRHVDHLETKAETLQRRIAELEGSTAWRLTAPLRWTVHWGRRAPKLVRLLPARLPRALALTRRVLTEEGWPGLGREIRRRATARGLLTPPRPPVYRLETAATPLTLPVSEAPKVSLIIPTYGQHQLAYTCLKALAEQPPEAAFEVLLVDDAAPEPAAEALAEVAGLRILRNPANQGFLASCNRAASEARGRYLLLLNNDTIVLEGAIDALYRTFTEQPQVGAVGARLIFPDGRLQEAGGIVWRDGSAWNFGRHADPDDPRYRYLRDVDYCSAACLMVPAGLFRELGGFDPRYAPAYYEDTDLCMALRDRGLRVLYQPAATVVHFEGASHGTDEATGLKAHQVRNRGTFRAKWATRLAGHVPNGVCPERERDRLAGPRVLWVEACMLTPDQDSGSLRTWRLLGLLQELGCKVTFIADNLEAPEPYAERLRQRGIEVQCAPYTRSVADYLRADGGHQDVIVLCRHYIAIQYVDLVREVAPQARLVFDTIDLHHLRLRRQAQLEDRDRLRRLADDARREELSIAERSDITLVVSDDEARELARQLPAARVVVISNIHDPVADCPPPQGRHGILFVGGFQHPPNCDAVRYYAEAIWPAFRAAHPDVPTYIVGSRMPDDLKRDGEAAGLTMLGYVADLQPLLDGCRVAISPLRYGAGVKGKVNQAMAMGLPVVATPASVEGMRLQDERDCLIAADAPRFVAAMERLYSDDDLWQSVSINGRRRMQEGFSSAVAKAALERLLGRGEAGQRDHLAGASGQEATAELNAAA